MTRPTLAATHYTAREAAARLGITCGAVLELHRLALLPGVRLHRLGRLWFRRDLVDGYADLVVAP